MKKIISTLMGMVLACQLAIPVFAQTQPTTQPTDDTSSVTQSTDGTADTTAAGGNTGADTSANQTEATNSEATALPAINSDSYIVMSADTGQVLISKNPDKKQYPANITKILTTAIALQYVDPDADYTITVEDVFPSYPESYRFSNGNYVAITQDEVVKVKDLINGSLIQSANDTANALANCAAKLANRSVVLEDGSTSYTAGFVEMMNEKAKEIGCVNSNFVNPHGLGNESHYTTAYDMALIMRYALTVPNFPQFFSQTSYTMEPTNKQSLPRNWGRVREGMMDPASSSYYKGTTGVKFGQTAEGGNTGIALVERDGIRLICVALNCSGSNSSIIQSDMVNLFDYCYNNFIPVTYTAAELAQKGYKTAVYNTRGEGSTQIGNATYSTDSDFTVLIHKNFSKDDVYVSADIPGRYYYDETMPSTLTFSMTDPNASQYMVPNMAALKLKVNVLTYDEIAQQKQAARKEFFQKVFKVIKIIFIVILVLFILLMIIRIRNKRKYKKRLARKKEQARRRQMQQNSLQNTNPPRSNTNRRR